MLEVDTGALANVFLERGQGKMGGMSDNFRLQKLLVIYRSRERRKTFKTRGARGLGEVASSSETI